jgi:RNA ligase (TIGR02306 family)
MRKMASVRKITNVLPIEGADAIELALVDGWQVVVKKGDFSVDQLAVYFEIDSWVPNAIAPFLTKGKEPREYNGVKGERLKTVKLRGALSQGLLLPVAVLPEGYAYHEGADCSEILGVQKWEAETAATQGGKAVSNWPSIIPKTDQERLQNLKSVFETKILTDRFEISEKLDGSSATYYIDEDGVFHAMSRNVDLARDENNLWWKMSDKYNIEEKLLTLWADNEFREICPKGFCIRGEIVGPGVNGNKLKLEQHFFCVFDLYDVATNSYATSEDRLQMVQDLGLLHVPVHKNIVKFTGTFEQLIQSANGKSFINPEVKREGIVMKSVTDPNFTFKVVSNEWLLEYKE